MLVVRFEFAAPATVTDVAHWIRNLKHELSLIDLILERVSAETRATTLNRRRDASDSHAFIVLRV